MAILLSLLSSLMWGCSDFAGGLLSKKRPALVVVGWSATIGAGIMTVVVLFGGGWHGPYGWVPWGAGAGAFGAAGLVGYYLALSTGTMGVVAPVTSLGVVVPVVVGLAQGESPSAITTLGVVVTIVGIVLTSGPEFAGEASARPVLIATAAGLCFGTFFVFMAKGSEDSPILSLWMVRATVATVAIGFALARRSTGPIVPADYSWLFFISAGDVGANLTFAYATTKGFVSITSVLSSLFPVVTVLLARIVLHERLRKIQISGVVVTMVGVSLISLG